jgi:hypothetical protein
MPKADSIVRTLCGPHDDIFLPYLHSHGRMPYPQSAQRRRPRRRWQRHRLPAAQPPESQPLLCQVANTRAAEKIERLFNMSLDDLYEIMSWPIGELDPFRLSVRM